MTPSSPAADAWTGRLVGGRWRILSRLDDSGGMASAYLADDERLPRKAVVKILQATHVQAEFADRVARETSWQSLVPDVNVVHLLDRGTEVGSPFLVLEYLSGGNLEAWCERNPSMLVDPRLHFHSWLLPIATTLDAIAATGHLHRNVKPSNILFDATRRVSLADCLQDNTFIEMAPHGMGVFIGTLQFTGPEQCDDDSKAMLDGRSDQYGLVVTVYQVLTGWRYPVDDTTVGLPADARISARAAMARAAGGMTRRTPRGRLSRHRSTAPGVGAIRARRTTIRW